MTTRVFRFVGCDKAGRPRTGARIGNPAPFVEAMFAQGWQSLRVSRLDADERTVEVGRIELTGNGGQRSWQAIDDDALVPGMTVGGVR